MFTEDGEITYAARQNILHAWGPSNSILRAILLAFVTTLLSYQATAAIIDFAFGTKKFGFAKVRDIQILLLTRRQSPYAVARSLFKKLPFSSLPNNDSRDPPGKLRPVVVFKLFLLLFVAPVVNIAAIFLTLEFETDLTFKEVDFGGIALGINMNATRRGYIPVSQACVRAPLSVGRAEVPLAEFAICDSANQPVVRQRQTATVRVLAVASNVLNVVLNLPFSDEAFFSVAHIINNDPELEFRDRYNFRLAHGATIETVSALANMIMARIQEFCGGGEVGNAGPGSATSQIKDAVVGLNVTCQKEDSVEAREWLRDLIEDVRSKIVFINSDELRVVRFEDSPGDDKVPDFVSGDNELFLRRRNTYADIFIMSILAMAMVVVRIFTRFVTRNDLPRGIGLIIRDELGIPCCDSMLPSKDVVATYSGLAHIGVRHGVDDD